MTQNITNQLDFSIVLPCYNPPNNWESIVVESINSLERRINKNIHLIIVNDGSNDNRINSKFDFINSKLSRFSSVTYTENRGKGYALRIGVAKSNTDLTIYTDIDFPYTLDSIEAIYTELQQGTDVVLGHRGKDYYKKTPWFRKVVSKTLRWFLKTFLRLPTDDSQCGIKGFNKRGKTAFLDTHIDRFLFDLEFIKLASRRKMNCKTVTVNLKPNVIFSKVNLKILSTEAINFIKVIFRK